MKESAATSTTVSVAGHPIALGLNWVVHRKDDRKALAGASAGNSFGYRMASGNRVLTGFYQGKGNRKMYAGAAILSDIFDGTLFVLPVEDKYWLLLISDGQPIAGFDQVITAEEATTCILQLQEIYTDLSLHGDAEFYKTHLPDAEFVATTFEDLFQKDRLQDNYRLSRQARKYLDYLPFVIVGIAVCIVGYAILAAAGFTKPIERIQQEKVQSQWEAQEAFEKDRIVRAFQDVTANHPIDNWLARLLKTLNKIPLEAGGWYFSKLDCSAGLPYCVVQWENSGYGTFKSLDYSVSNLGPLELKEPAHVSQTIHIMEFDKTVFSEEEMRQKIVALPTVEQFKLDHVSVFQLLGTVPYVNFDIKSPEVIPGLSLPPVGIEPTIEFPSFARGKWSLNGKGLQVLSDAVLKLDNRVFHGQSLKMSIIYSEDEINAVWEIGGDYVSKI
ncbi:type 4b pilus protein PilO2 [Kistimonas asteriae]|uniref:type 4b pilus protein PilO2 n=1 Tax=Kistimonas asteriae TaxID=517724 RepID=UPI001BA72EEF|nr:type 4b pilus protein PilO2 [Kistimonas asteriae]